MTRNMESLLFITAITLLTPPITVFQVISSIGYVLGFGLGAAAFLGFVIIGLMSLPGVVFLLVWVSILVVLAIWVLLGYVHVSYVEKKNSDEKYIRWSLYLFKYKNSNYCI